MEVVAEAHDGHTAMQLIELHKPHIVLLDIMMEDMNGTDVLTAVKAAHPDMIVMMISSAASSDNVKRSFDAGADGFLVKPFNTSRVLDELKHAIPMRWHVRVSGTRTGRALLDGLLQHCGNIRIAVLQGETHGVLPRHVHRQWIGATLQQ